MLLTMLVLSRASAAMQEEEDRRVAAGAHEEAVLQSRMRQLEAAEAAAEADEAAAAALRGWPRRGFLGSLLGAGPVGGLLPPRPTNRGPRSQRSRRSPLADAEFASAMGHLMPPYRGGYLGGFDALQQMVGGLSRGLPADLLLR
jgi:hypothetical protein